MQLIKGQTPDFFADIKQNHKKADIIVGIVIIAIIIITIGISMALWFFYDEHMEPVKSFFRGIENNNLQAAYEQTDPLFRKKISYEDFPEYLIDKRLDQYFYAIWDEPVVDGDIAIVRGDITIKSEATFPYLIKLRENDDGIWKIINITDNSRYEGIATMTKTEAKAYVRQVMDNFIISIENKDLELFYKNTSVQLQEEYTLNEFINNFRVFYDLEIYLRDVMAGELVLDQFTIIDPDINNILIYGKASSEVNVLDFEIEALYENNVWRIASLYLSID